METCEDGEIRLKGGKDNKEGYVELCKDEEWGKVCKDEWDISHSKVVCTQLNYTVEGITLLSLIMLLFYVPKLQDTTGFEKFDCGRRISPFVVKANCSGSEQKLADCNLDITLFSDCFCAEVTCIDSSNEGTN